MRRQDSAPGPAPASPQPFYSPHLGLVGEGKGKKWWGEKLRLSRPPQRHESHSAYLLNEYRHKYGTLSSGSALSRSMKYAETWLYGSVRTPPPTFLVNICSCPEQLAPGGGTRRGLRSPHAGICKKCGGSRAVYAPAGGTVRAPRSRPALFIPTQPPPPPLSAPPPPLKAATPDPYDLMRRNRLGTMGDPTANSNAVHRGRTRAKSSSPTRRMQPHRSPSPSVVRPTQFNVNKLSGMEASADKRKSILECDVNAYELIAKYLKGDRKAFVSTDDDALSDDLSDNALENGSPNKTEQNYNSRQSVGGGVTIGGQRIRISASQSLCDINDYVTDEDEEDEVPPPRFATLSFRRSSPPPSPASAIPRPRRPPRKQKSAVTTPLTPSESEDDSELLAAAACLLESPAIKSILKKPADAFCDTVSKPDLPVRSPSPADFYLPTFQEFRQQRKKKQVQFVCFTPDEDHTVPEATLVGGDEEEEEEDDDRDEESEKDDEVGSSDDATPIGVQLGHDARRQSEESFSQELALVAATANLPPRPPGAATLRRSLSDRLAIQPPPVAAAFNDTMRLRQRPRSDSRLVFEHVSHQSLSAELPPRRPQRVLSPGRPRPREPPPPPPPLPPAAPQRVRAPPLGMLRKQQPARRPPSISLSTDDISLPVELNSQPSPQQNPKGLQVPKLGRPNSWASSVEGRDIFRKKEHRNSDPGPGPGGLKPGQTLLQSSTELDEESGDSVVPSMEQDQLDRLEADARTIVTVTSPPSPSIHRLQVRSESVSNLGAESPLSSRRTSIFISSGIHHSEGLRRAASEFDLVRNGASRTSVSVRGQSPVVDSTKRDINKVTISVGGVTPNPEHYQRSSSRTVIDTSNPNIIYNKNNTSSLTILSPSDTLSNHIVIPVTPEPSSIIFLGSHSSVEVTNRATNNSPFLWPSETEYTPESDEKCLPNKITILDSDTGDNSSISNVIIETTAETIGNEVSEEEADEEDPSELDEETKAALLKDPVEAVRRNLVPHVCGKTDPISAVDRLSTLLSKQEETPQEDPYLLDGAKANSEADDTAKSLLLDTTDLELAANDDIDDEIENVYESIKDHIYEEIGDVASTHSPQVPPQIVEETSEDGQTTSRSIFEGASKYDILNYLADARERVPEEESVSPAGQEQPNIELSSRASQLSNASDSSEDSISAETPSKARKSSAEIERNDSGVGSETSKSSRSRWQQAAGEDLLPCEDCDQRVDTHVSESGVVYAPLVCRKCAKRRAERKELLAEIVDTEEKYARDLKITLDEFYRPMLVAGLLTPDQLASIFLNTQELLEHSRALAHKLRDSLDMALEQGDEDFLTVNMGRLFLEAAPMLHAFESYCTRQGAASMLLANLEKERELLRIFLRVNQMDNAVLRRMNLNSFLMVPVQRVTKYPLLLARLYKVTPAHHEGRELLKQAQHKIELHLEHINSEAKDISTMKLWRRISIINGRRSSSESDMINIKLRKMALEILEWNRDEISFSMEGKLLYTNPTDNNWRKGRTIKLNPINALLVTKGKTQEDYQPEPTDDLLMFPRKNGVREATLLLVREKSGRYSLLRDPLFLDKCIVCCETDWEDYFEVQELASKETFIFKGEDGERTKIWYRTLQYHAQGLGAWRRRRNALANIINDMVPRN